uniref:Protein encore n=1 Tax=Ceratitis capitata TaxID=7213 RepID=W8AEX7_CERCA
MDVAKLEKMKVIDLRKELETRGLDTKGVKAVLVERLRAFIEDGVTAPGTPGTPGRRSRRTRSMTRSPSPSPVKATAVEPNLETLAEEEDNVSSQDVPTDENVKEVIERAESVEIENTDRNEEIPEEQMEVEPHEKVEHNGEDEHEEEVDRKQEADNHQEEIEEEKEVDGEKEIDEEPLKADEVHSEVRYQDDEDVEMDAKENQPEEEAEEKEQNKSYKEKKDAKELEESKPELSKRKRSRTRSHSKERRGRTASRSRSRSHSKSRSRSKSRLESKSRSRSPKRRSGAGSHGTPSKAEEASNPEDEPTIEDKQFGLSWFDSDLHLRIDPVTFTSAKPMSHDVYSLIWSGARTNYGVREGKVCFEVRLAEETQVGRSHQFRDEPNLRGFRVGFSLPNTTLLLGEAENSFAYCESGRKATNSDFTEFSKPYQLDDVIGCYLDLDSTPCNIKYTLNGEDLGVAFEFDKSILGESDALFPHIVTKGYEYHVNFADNENLLANVERPKRMRRIPKKQKETEKEKEKVKDEESKEETSKKTEEGAEKTVEENDDATEKTAVVEEDVEMEEKDEVKEPQEIEKTDDKAEELKPTEDTEESNEKLAVDAEKVEENGDKPASTEAEADEKPSKEDEKTKDKEIKKKDEEDNGPSPTKRKRLDSKEKRRESSDEDEYEEVIPEPRETVSLLPDYELIALIPEEKYVSGPQRPNSRKECEVILLVGLPGAGKTQWTTKHINDNPEKRYHVIGADALIAKMTIDGAPRKTLHKGRWERVYELCLNNLSPLEEIATKRRRNFILDQTNVYASAQRRKMKGFGDFKRIAVVCIPNEDELKRRNTEKTEKGNDNTIRESTLNNLRANFTLPSTDLDWFDEVIFTDLSGDEAKSEVKRYNEKGKKALDESHPNKRNRRDHHQRGDDRRHRDGGGGGGGRRDFHRWNDRRGGGGGGGHSGGGGNRWAGGGGGGGGGKKHRTNSNSKGNKPRLKNIGGSSSGSVDGGNSNSNNTSGFISRENSSEQFTDHGGTDLFSFFKETLNKHPKDRHFLLKVEKDLTEFVQEKSRGELRFPPASSYNRMLIHRTAAFFGMEHNVDTETQQCVIVAATKNTRIPEIRFKSLVRDHRDDTRKSILKRDTHSFDEARQSSYLCPDRGSMLDRKAKSFEEREEDYERARSRIFNRSQNDNGEGMDDGYMNVSWTQSVEHQQQQQQHPQNRSRPNGKMMKMQNSNESRDGRSGGGAVPKSHNFNNYSGGGSQGGGGGGGAPLMRGDSGSSSKNGGSGGARSYSKQDSAGSNNTPWRLSPSSSGSIYHFDPSNLPPNQQTTYHPNQGNSNNASYAQQPSPQQQQQQQHQQQQQVQEITTKKHKSTQQLSTPSPIDSPATTPTPQIHLHCKNVACNEGVVVTIPLAESVSESSTQTVAMCGDINCDGIGLEMPINATEEASTQSGGDECDNTSATGCLSITTTTSTKSYDRIEVQKFKNQATSPNIPADKDELPKQRESTTALEGSTVRDQQPVIVSQPTVPPPPSQTPTNSVNMPLQRETPHSARSTPFSSSESTQAKNRASEEPKPTAWTYTQSYQAPDGSTVFHTTTTPSGTPYCTTTYQQGPDGSVYAIPQGMVYAYPPPVEGEVQSYFMPVFDPNQPRTDATGLIPTGAQAIYPSAAAAAGSTATMVPVAAAYPTAQFATANGTPIYPGQLIYSSDQFATGAATVAAAAPANGQLQQIPMTTYPIGYPYAYNGYWGQPMTYYVPQQALTNAVAATPLLPAPPQPQGPTTATAQTVAGPHLTSGINIANGLVAATAAAGPPSNTTVGALGSSSGNSNVSGGIHAAGHHVVNTSASSSSYQTHSGTTYYGTGRVKRPTSSHYTGHQSGGHQLVTAAIPSNGSATTTYQLGHAVPTLTLAPAPGSAAAAVAAAAAAAAAVNTSTDLNVGSAATPATTMYTLPQHAALLHANIFPYAPASAAAAAAAAAAGSATGLAAGTPPVHTPGAPPTATPQLAAASMTGAAAHAQPTNAVITPFYAHHPPMTAAAHPTHGSATVHTPGPAAIPIVDPSTLTAISHPTPTGANSSNNVTPAYSGCGSASQSAPSTPHSVPTQTAQRNPPLFSTPPIMNSNGGSNNGGYSGSSTPQYYTVSTGGDGGATLMSSPHGNSYVQHEKRNNNNSNMNNSKKPPAYPSNSLSRQNSSSYNGGGASNGKPPLLGGNNDTRASPNSGGGGYQGSRPHGMNKRGGGDKPQTPLLSGPPSYGSGPTVSVLNSNNNSGYHVHHNNTQVDAKPPIRLNAGAATFRQKGSGAGVGVAYEFRRSASQRNSPGTATNSSSNDNSSNTSPNSIVGSTGGGANTPNCYATTATGGYVNASIGMVGGGDHQTVATATGTPLYIASARGAHIPPQLQHGGMVAAAAAAGGTAAGLAGTQQATTAAVLGGAAAAEVANAAAAAVAATVAHHQPLLSAYQPGASGVYIKYGQTYYAHPSVALPNSRRSPSTELRPAMAPVAGMYPTVNMMIPAAPRHTQGRHPNPNYKGNRPR